MMMNSPPLPPFRLWFTLILMPAFPDYQQQRNELQAALTAAQQERRDLVNQLEQAKDDHTREALETALTECRGEIRRITTQLSQLIATHADRN